MDYTKTVEEVEVPAVLEFADIERLALETILDAKERQIRRLEYALKYCEDSGVNSWDPLFCKKMADERRKLIADLEKLLDMDPGEYGHLARGLSDNDHYFYIKSHGRIRIKACRTE